METDTERSSNQPYRAQHAASQTRGAHCCQLLLLDEWYLKTFHLLLLHSYSLKLIPDGGRDANPLGKVHHSEVFSAIFGQGRR